MGETVCVFTPITLCVMGVVLSESAFARRDISWTT